MPIHIYNTLTRKKEEFKPQNPPKVKMYTCGVTVYDECHIGHARSLYIFDVIRRYLEYRKFKVDFVRNITDIDDKIINRATELKIDWRQLVKKYIDSYKKDLESLGIQSGMLDRGEEPRATKNIPDMVKYIEGLINKDFAYITDSGVYFSVRKFNDYGKLSGQSIDQMLSGARVEANEQKRDPLDFALWKSSTPNEPSWPSPWGDGRPGWHVECSVMSQKFLNTDTLDIHGGGRDLVFPHHENEIAQSEALTGKPFAKYWIHHGLLTINGQKMAKSLGNFITVKDFIKKYGDTDILKLFFLTTHYSNPVDYNEGKIEVCRKQKANFELLFGEIINRLQKGNPGTPTSKEDISKIDDICAKFKQVMDDNFNTPQALAAVLELINLGFDFLSSDKEEACNYIKCKLESLLSIFGITVVTRPIPEEVKKEHEKRDKEREKKNFEKADQIKKDLTKKGYAISDTGSSSTIYFDILGSEPDTDEKD